MNDASESSAVTCVKMVDNHPPAGIWALGMTPREIAILKADGTIKSMATPLKESEITTAAKTKFDGPPSYRHPINIGAFNEIMALGDALVRGDITNIARKHNAHVGTVQKMVHNAKGRPARNNLKNKTA